MKIKIFIRVAYSHENRSPLTKSLFCGSANTVKDKVWIDECIDGVYIQTDIVLVIL